MALDMITSPQRRPGCAGHVTLHRSDLDAGGAAGLAADRALLSPAEHARADRFRFARDRDRFTRGRAFLRRVLGAETCQPADALRLIEGPWGKPALADGGLDFNLSHSGAFAMLAVSTGGPVGIDVELLDRTVDIDRLSISCFTTPERVLLNDLVAGQRIERFFAFWTAKEALMKLTGQGMSLPPLEISLCCDDGWPVACARPDTIAATLSYPDTGRSDAICCLAAPADVRADVVPREAMS